MKLHAILLIALVMICATKPIYSQPLDAEMLELEKRWNEAHLNGDVAALGALWAEDLQIVVPSMEPMSKAVALEFWKKVPVLFTTYESEIISTRPLQDGAIVLGRLHRVREFGGRRSEDRWTFTKVYSRVSGKWQVVAYHASPSPQ